MRGKSVVCAQLKTEPPFSGLCDGIQFGRVRTVGGKCGAIAETRDSIGQAELKSSCMGDEPC